MKREGGEEGHMLQLQETWTHHGRMSRFQEQDVFLHEAKETVCKEGVQSHLGFGSESEDEVDTANMCFMANSPKVTSEPSYDDIEISKEEFIYHYYFNTKRFCCIQSCMQS